MAEKKLLIAAPAVKVARKSEMELARQACREWAKIDPLEVAAWRRRMQWKVDQVAACGAWSASRELMVAEDFPAFVMYRLRHLLVEQGWADEDANAWSKDADTGKSSKLFKAVVAELLPEASPTRREQRRVSHGGWSA